MNLISMQCGKSLSLGLTIYATTYSLPKSYNAEQTIYHIRTRRLLTKKKSHTQFSKCSKPKQPPRLAGPPSIQTIAEESFGQGNAKLFCKRITESNQSMELYKNSDRMRENIDTIHHDKKGHSSQAPTKIAYIMNLFLNYQNPKKDGFSNPSILTL